MQNHKILFEESLLVIVTLNYGYLEFFDTYTHIHTYIFIFIYVLLITQDESY